jgi:hypothetical protein
LPPHLLKAVNKRLGPFLSEKDWYHGVSRYHVIPVLPLSVLIRTFGIIIQVPCSNIYPISIDLLFSAFFTNAKITTMNDDNDPFSSKPDDDFLEYLMGDDDDDEDDAALLSLLLRHRSAKRKRRRAKQRKRRNVPYYVRDRLEWGVHVEKLLAEGPSAFTRMYRMDHESFVKLSRLMEPLIERDLRKAQARWGQQHAITTEIALHCLLRFLAGGSYLDIRLSAGISVPSFYRILHLCIDGILRCEEMSFSFPSTNEQFQEIADGFKALSTKEVFDGCVGCLDGLLLKIRTPSNKEAGNVKAFFSGHYQTYG